jgi:hypothetical protein
MSTHTICHLDMVSYERGMATGLGPVVVGMASQPVGGVMGGASTLTIWWPLGVGLHERDVDG